MPNDVYTPRQVMQQLITVLPTGTHHAAIGSTILIDDATSLYQNSAIWPAAVVREGKQTTARIDYRTWQTKLTLQLDYYDRWDQQPTSLSAIWANIDTDLRLMKANLENNPGLIVTGVRYVESVVSTELSEYQAALTQTDKPFPVPTLNRQLIILLNLLPFLSTT